jgi:hypothetical protein
MVAASKLPWPVHLTIAILSGGFIYKTTEIKMEESAIGYFNSLAVYLIPYAIPIIFLFLAICALANKE